MNADGGEALRRCLPEDLFELYLETSRRTPARRQSIVLDNQLNELSAQPHFGPPNEGPRPHTAVHRRALRRILMVRLGDAFHPDRAVTGYEEDEGGVRVHLADGGVAHGDVLVGADGIRSAIRRQRLPEVRVIDTGIGGIGVFGRSPLTPEALAEVPPLLLEGFIIAADRTGNRVLLGAFQPRRPLAEAAAAIAPDVALEPVQDYLMVSCSVAPGTEIPSSSEWTLEAAERIRASMLTAIEDFHPGLRGVVARIEPLTMFAIPFGLLEPPAPWEPSRVTLIGDAAHAMLPSLGLGANLSLRDSGRLLERLCTAARGETDLVAGIGAFEADMREYTYPFMRMAMEHDQNFGGGGLKRLREAASSA